MIFVQFTISSTVLCLCIYQMLTTNLLSVEFAYSSSYLGSMLIQIYLYCWFGNEVTLKVDYLNILKPFKTLSFSGIFNLLKAILANLLFNQLLKYIEYWNRKRRLRNGLADASSWFNEDSFDNYYTICEAN